MSALKKASLAALFLLAVSLSLLFYTGEFSSKIHDELQKGKPLVLYFSASWCPACKKQKPILSKIKKEFPELTFFEIDSKLSKIERKILFKEYKVSGMPTLILFKRGKEFKRLEGLQSKEELRKSFSNLD